LPDLQLLEVIHSSAIRRRRVSLNTSAATLARPGSRAHTLQTRGSAAYCLLMAAY
jgi:hypothetical protein